MTAALVKLVAAGLVCAALLTLNGGGQKELLRLGCACLTVVVLLSVLRQTELPALDTQQYRGQVQPQVEEAQAQLRQAQLRQTEEQLAAELERQAQALGLTCNAQADCAADREGRVTVVQVVMTYLSGPRDQLEPLRQSLCTQLAIAPGQIIIQEGTP